MTRAHTGSARLRDRVRRGPSPIHGNGCFARVAFSAGDFIGTYQGPAARRDGTYVLWISDDHIHWTGRSGRNLLRWLNHSDAPNAEFDGFDLYALTEIGVGEEITFDYSAGDVEGGGESAGNDPLKNVGSTGMQSNSNASGQTRV